MYNIIYQHITAGGAWVTREKEVSSDEALSRVLQFIDSNPDYRLVSTQKIGQVKVADIILQQLGGRKFIAMTGCNNFVADHQTLRMTIPKNGSRANRLYITLDPDDTYTMRFFRYTAPKLSRKTFEYIPEKVEEVALFETVYFDQLQELFTEVTKMYTRL